MATNPLRPVLLAAGRSRRLERVVARSVLTRSLVERFIAGSTEPEVVGAVADLLGSGRVVSVDHGCGAHSSVVEEEHVEELPAPVWETIDWEQPRSLFD